MPRTKPRTQADQPSVASAAPEEDDPMQTDEEEEEEVSPLLKRVRKLNDAILKQVEGD